jgi:hypothetical protein
MVVCKTNTVGKTEAEVGMIGGRRGLKRKLQMPMLRSFSELRTCSSHTCAAAIPRLFGTLWPRYTVRVV